MARQYERGVAALLQATNGGAVTSVWSRPGAAGSGFRRESRRRRPERAAVMVLMVLLLVGVQATVPGRSHGAAPGGVHRQLAPDEMLLQEGRVYRQHLAGYEVTLPGRMVSVPTPTLGERLFIRVDGENRPLYAVSVSFEVIAEPSEDTYLYDRLEAAIFTAADRLHPQGGLDEAVPELGHTEMLSVGSFDAIRQEFALPAPVTGASSDQESGPVHHLIQVVDAGWRGIILLAAGTGSGWDDHLPEILDMFDSLRID